MKKTRLIAFAALASLGGTPALADAAAVPQQRGSAAIDGNAMLDRGERQVYQRIFADIRAGNWEAAQGAIAGAPRGILHPVARAELYLAPGSPVVPVEQLEALLREAPDLPGARRLMGLAEQRGLDSRIHLPAQLSLRTMPRPSRRSTARPVRSDAAARELVGQIRPLIVEDRPREAESLLNARGGSLSPEGITEVRQRIAWSYYLVGDDRNAQRLARQARRGPGDWAVQADWVDGLASWRARDCEAAADAFASVARRAPDSELRAAGLYWAARSEMVCQRPQNVQALLRSAAQSNETFYGLLASQTLAMAPQADSRAPLSPGWDSVATEINARRAMALVEIGERSLAEDYVRFGSTIGNPHHHDAWLDLANELRLPNAELWIARNAPISHHPSTHDRFPAPDYQPIGGWRVDRSLVFAHALQESDFRPDAVSHVGARGLLQLMPGTAREIARDRGETVDASRLNVPEVNIEYGQFYMERMRDYPSTQGLLPKVIASYNAGPGAVSNWQGTLRDRGDPLLFIESIPYYETRGYVPIILRNYWMYQRNAEEETPSLAALAQGMWPRFPGTPGPTAVRLNAGHGMRVGD